MSMFHELMMRKKEQIMYATIKGSLTENDGVFSGFSSSNYLQLQQNLDTSKPFEIVVKFTTDTLSLNNSILYESSYGFFIRMKYSSGRKIYIDLSHSVNYDVANNVGGRTTLKNDTTYWLKFSFDLSKYVVSLSTDGINYTEDIVVNSTLILKNSGHIDIGSREGTSTYVQGSIDLSNSYIKLGSTKYNLQAVVGYTIVGSPTITDGVVSGFFYAYGSADNAYISINNFPSIQRSIEIVTKLKVASYGTTYIGVMSGGTSSEGSFLLRLSTTGVLSFSPIFTYADTNFILTSDTPLLLNTDYTVKISQVGTNYKMSLSTDGNTFVAVATATSTLSIIATRFNYGIAAVYSNHGFTGSIDMNETLIKKDNKLWFNGQEG